MIDKELIKERFSKATKSYDKEAVAQKMIAKRMNDIISNTLAYSPSSILEIGTGTGFLSRYLLSTFHPNKMTLNDLCEEMKPHFTDIENDNNIDFIWGDAEDTAFPANQNLIVSCSTIQWFNNLEDFFKRCSTLLSEKGYFAFSTFGCDNLKEISYLTGSSLDYHSISTLSSLLEPYFEIVYSGEEHISLTFDKPIDTLYHLKRTGVSAIKRERFTKKKLEEFSERYIDKFGKSGKVKLTYNPIYFVARKKITQ